MAIDQNDLLLQRIIDELGEIRKVLGERLPQPVDIKLDSVQGKVGVVVTGEGSAPSPVTSKPSPVKKTAAPKLGR